MLKYYGILIIDLGRLFSKGVFIMRCFIHFEKEAVAACRTCGKGMCADCSAYSGHNGICPECRKIEFEKEREALKRHNNSLSTDITGNIIWGILLCWTIIGLIWNVVSIIAKSRQKGENNKRIDVLTEEIDRLESVMKQRGGRAFI